MADQAGADPLRIARQIALLVLASEVAILAITGVWLVFNYRPSSGAAWTDVRVIQHGSLRGLGVRVVHRDVAHLAVLTSLAVAGLVVADADSNHVGRRKAAAIAVAAGLPVCLLAASFTGYLLPWDQLALWAVTVGTNMKGYPPAFGSQTRFVLLGGVEISKATLWRWFLVHTVLLTVVTGALLGVAARIRPNVRNNPAEAPPLPDQTQPR